MCICYYNLWSFHTEIASQLKELFVKISWKCAHSQGIQDVDEFVSSSDLEKCSITSLAHQWMWMGAVRMRVQTADKNITIIHKESTPLQSISLWLVKWKAVFVRNKFIIKTLSLSLTSDHCFRLKFTGAFSSKEKMSRLKKESNLHKIKHRLQTKTVQNSSKQICWWILMWDDKRRWTFSGGSLIIDYGLKSVLMKNLFLSNMQLFTSRDINWWTGVVWIAYGLLWYFILILTAPIHIHWWASDAILNFSKSDEETNSSTSWMTRGCNPIFSRC